MSGFTTATELAILNSGRVPLWTKQSGYAGAPDAVGDGADLGTSTRAAVVVALRQEAHRRRIDLAVGTFDAAATYTLRISGGTSLAVAAPASVSALFASLAAAVLADSGSAALVTATASATGLTLLGKAEATYYASWATSGGSAVVSATGDAETATARVWVQWAGTAASGSTAPAGLWACAKDLDAVSVTRRGWTHRLDVAGMARVWVELASVTGHASDVGITAQGAVYCGPAQAE
jgi:hypothetical protein